MQRTRWVGFVLDWSGKSSFGRQPVIPRQVQLSCYASSSDEAHVLLHIQAERQGYALGGVQEIKDTGALVPNSAPARRQYTFASQSRQAQPPKKLTRQEMLAALAELDSQLSTEE